MQMSSLVGNWVPPLRRLSLVSEREEVWIWDVRLPHQPLQIKTKIWGMREFWASEVEMSDEVLQRWT